MTLTVDLTDRRLLNTIQAAFPLVEEPYAALGTQLEISEAEVIERIKRLRGDQIVRQISAIFDSRRLGYRSTLVAMRYPPERLDEAAEVINGHSGVSHNYARNSNFNLWFTLAVPPSDDLDETVEGLARKTGAEAFHMLPTIRLFKIGVNFDMVRNVGAAHQGNGTVDDEASAVESASVSEDRPLTEAEIRAVRELQDDLPLVSRPFDAMSERLKMAPQELFEVARSLQERGAMRRYSAVLHHRQAGFTANGMGVWEVPPERSEEVGRIMATFPSVSHCYQRPIYPDWPYSHFSMIHATSREECEEVAREISRKTGISNYMLLFSTREYKKTRVRYFE